MTKPAASPTRTTNEDALARLLAALSALIDALIDHCLLPGFYRTRLRARFAAYFADITTLLTTPHAQRIAAPCSATHPAPASIHSAPIYNARSATAPTSARRHARKRSPVNAPLPAAASIPHPRNPTRAPIRAVPPFPRFTSPPCLNLQKPGFAPIVLHA